MVRAVLLDSIRDHASSDVHGRGSGATVPDHVNAGQVGEMGVAKVDLKAGAPDVTLAFDPI